MTGEGQPADRLWVERLARVTGVERCCRWLWGEAGGSRAPYVLVVAVWSAVNLVPRVAGPDRFGTATFGDDPASVFVLGAVLALVAFLRVVRRRYRSVVAELPASARSTDGEHARVRRLLAVLGVPTAGGERPVFAHVTPDRVTGAVLVLGWGLYALWFVTDPAPLSPLVGLYGPVVARVKLFVLIPLLYYLVAAEVLSTYLGVHLFLPAKIALTDRIDFTDPLGFGGLRPVGVFLRDSTASYVVLLSGYVVYETISLGTSPLDPFSLGVLSGGTVLGVALFATPVYMLHRHMARHKERKIAAVAAEVAAIGPPDDTGTFPETAPQEVADYEEYTHAYVRLRTVREMREFPVDVALVLEFVSVLVIPYVVSLTSDAIAHLLALA